MNIQNYILPVSIAAAIHVAFLMYGVSEPRTPVIKGPDKTQIQIQPMPEDLIVQREEEADPDQAVQPLAGGPVLVSLDEPPVTPKATDITITRDETRREMTKDISIIPAITGMDGTTIIDGHLGVPKIFSPTQLDRIPRATVQKSPNYPTAMLQNGITGSVTVEFDVDTQGRVTRAEAIKYTRREFADPAVQAVLQWHFEPGKRNGRPVPFRMAVPIEFNRFEG